MNKTLLALAFLCCMGTAATAQLSRADSMRNALLNDNIDTVAWVHTGTFNLGINQGFLHNWAAGGELGSLSVNSILNARLVHLNHNKVWTNTLDAAYSLFYAYSNQFVPRKIDDRLELTSKYGIQLDTSKDFFLTGLFNFRSQFTDGYDYSIPNWDAMPTSSFMSPAYLTLAIGMEYSKGTNLSLFLSPIAARYTFADRLYTTRFPEGAFGIAYGETSRFELGAYFSGRYTTEISKNVTFRTRLDLYSNYLAKDKTDTLGNVVKTDSPGNIDIFWDNFFSFKISRFFSFTFAATLVYDNDIPFMTIYVDEAGIVQQKAEPGMGLGWWQVKQILTFGFEYKF